MEEEAAHLADEPEEMTPTTGHRPELDAPTLRQEELRGFAQQALDQGSINLAIAASISLLETPENSAVKLTGAMLLSDLYLETGETAQAIAVLDTLISTFPPMAETAYLYGQTMASISDWPAAETHLRRAIEIDPYFLRSYRQLINVLVEQGERERAIEVSTDYDHTLGLIINFVNNEDANTTERLASLENLILAEPDLRIDQSMINLLDSGSEILATAAIQVLANIGMSQSSAALEAYAETGTNEEINGLARQVAALLRDSSR